MESSTNNIFITNPVLSKPSIFPEKGWTGSVSGYLNAARAVSACLYENDKLSNKKCKWFITLNLHKVFTPDTISEAIVIWKKVCRKLKSKGFNAFWVIEPTEENRVHYHILVKNCFNYKECESIFDDSCAIINTICSWHRKIESINSPNPFKLYTYCLKAKYSEFNDKMKFEEDAFKGKRLLFKPKMGVQKYGKIGDFWHQSRKEIQAKVESKWDKNAGIAMIVDSLFVHPDMVRLGEYFADLTAECLPKVRKNIALTWSPSLIADAIGTLKADKHHLFASENYKIDLDSYEKCKPASIPGELSDFAKLQLQVSGLTQTSERQRLLEEWIVLNIENPRLQQKIKWFMARK